MWYIVLGYITILLEIVCCKIFFDTFMQSEKIGHYTHYIVFWD